MNTKYSLAKPKGLALKMLLAFLLCFTVTGAFGQVLDAFKLRGPGGLQGDPNTCIFSLHGDFTMIANVNLWAASATDAPGTINNNTTMSAVDLDASNLGTSNSSMAELKLNSSCSKIVYAGLYWTAKTDGNVTDAAKKTVKLRGPGAAAYTTLTSPMYSRTPGSSNQYICFTDVTQYVKTQGVGQYWVADIALSTGMDASTGYYAGWGMVVIYEDQALPMRNIAMFDGYAYVATGTNQFSLPITGFKSAQNGPVKVKLGFMAGEGDAGYSGDWCQMKKATAVGDVNNDADWIHLENPSTAFAQQNFWRSRVTNDAGAARNPNRTNNLGFDAFVMTADNTNNQFIGNNQTSTAIRYGTNLDQYIIFNITMAVDAYEPEPQAVNQVNTTGTTYSDQKTVGPGDTMTYRIQVTNQGNEAVLNNRIEIPVPFNATYVANSISATYTSYLTGANTTYDPAAQKIIINLGTLPIPPASNPDTVFATITYKLKATTDCYYLKNPVACLRSVGIQGTITGTGAITGVAVNTKTIAGFAGGACAQTPISAPTTSNIVVPPTYTACDSYVITTPNLRICPGAATSITATTVRSLLTLPSSITYVFNSAANGSGTVYNDNNPFPITNNATYYAVPVNTTDTACKGSIPFIITILSVNTPPTVATTQSFCQSLLPGTLTATATSVDYSIFWYTQATGGTSSSGITIPANTAPGTYTYYVAQGYDASCQSSRTPVTVNVNATPVAPSLNGSSSLCGGSEDSYSIVSPNGAFTYEWALDNAPVGVAFKNGITTGTTITLTEAAAATGTFTVKVRAKETATGCYSDYRTLSVTVNPKPATPSTFTGPTEACEGSDGNVYTLTAPVGGANYEWKYTGTGYTWSGGSFTTQSVELIFATGATSGTISVRAKTTAGCYSDSVGKAVTINPRPAAPASVLADTICVSQNGFVKVNSTLATLKYQVYNGATAIGSLTQGTGGTISIDLGTYATAGTYNYTVKSFNDKCYSSAQTPVSLVVLNIPASPVLSSGVTTCYSTPPVISVLNAVVGATYRVYSNVGLTTLLTTATANTTPFNITITHNPTANTTYYVTSSNGICASPASTVSVIVRDQIMPPAATADGVCVGQKPAILVSNWPYGMGTFDSTIYQYKLYSDAAGTIEVPLKRAAEQISATEMVLSSNTAISASTTYYVRLIAFGCNGPLTTVPVNIAPRPAPNVVTTVTQCLGTRALITIHNTVKGNRYRVFAVPNPTLADTLRNVLSLQNGDQVISLSQAVPWSEGTIFYVQEAVRDENDLTDLCLSPIAQVTMQSGTPAAPAFAFNPVYTCSGTTATLTITNALTNRVYHIYNSPTDLTPIDSVNPNGFFSQYPFNVTLPNITGSTTYYMDMLENGTACSSLRAPVTITLSTPNQPVLLNANLTVCRGSIPVITVSNAQQGVSYTITNSVSGDTVAGPLVAPANGSLGIPIVGLNLTGQQTVQYSVRAAAPASQNSCVSPQTTLNLTDGEPVMPTMPNLTVCHSAAINVSVPSPVVGYTYLVYDAANNLLGTANASGNVTIPAPAIPNPATFTNVQYYVKVQSSNCMSVTNAPFTVRVNRTAEGGVDYIVSAPVVCEHSDVVFGVKILSPALVASGTTIKWYNNSDLTGLIDTQIIPAGSDTATKTITGLPDGTYVYSVTAQSAVAQVCENIPAQAFIATAVVKPHAVSADISALDAVICNGNPVTLVMQLNNPAITNPVYNWYSDINHTILVAANTPTFTPNPNLIANADYYVTVHNQDYCENLVNDDEWIHVDVNALVLPPTASVIGNNAICPATNLELQVTPAGSVSGYELWENGLPVANINYFVNLSNNRITVFNPSVGTHTYTVVTQFFQNSILCKSDETSPVAQVTATVNDVVPVPTISLETPNICRGDLTTIHITYTGIQPIGYKLMNGSGVVDPILYTISPDMQTISLSQPALGNHSYTLISLVSQNGTTCESQPSVPATGFIYQRPAVSLTNTGADTLCHGTSGSLTLQFTGTAPFTYSVQAVDDTNHVTYLAQNVTTGSSSVILTPTVSSKMHYIVSALSDANCTALPADLPTATTLYVYPELQPGALMVAVEVCNNTNPGDLNVTSAFDGDIKNYEYSWQQDVGSGYQPILDETNVFYSPGVLSAGTYKFQRTITDGCQTKVAQTEIMVNSDLVPGSLIADTSICNNTSPGFLSKTLPTGGNNDQYSYLWYVFDTVNPNGLLIGLTGLEADYNPGVLTTGTYRYMRITYDACQSDTNFVTVKVFDDLKPGLLNANVSLCLLSLPQQLNVNLATGGDSSKYQYSWQRWNGINAFVDLSPTVTTALHLISPLDLLLGSNILQRTVTDGCQTVSVTATITLFEDLQPGELRADTAICNGTSPGELNKNAASLCGAGSGITYQWQKETTPGTWVDVSPDGTLATYNPGNLATGTYKYRRVAEHTVLLPILVLYRDTTAVLTVTVLPNLTAGTLVQDTSICNGTTPGNLNRTVSTGGNTALYSYNWQLLNGTTFEDLAPAVHMANYTPTPLATGTYTYRRVVTDGCQTAMDTTIITVFSNLVAGTLKIDTVCNGTTTGDLNLTLPSGGNSANYSYTWQVSNGGPLADISPLVLTATHIPVNFTLPGTYLFQRTVSDGCITQTAQTSIVVRTNPEAYVSAVGEICQGQDLPLLFTFTQASPWTVTFVHGSGNTQEVKLFDTPPPYQFTIPNPTESSFYTIKKVVDGHGCTTIY